MKSKKTHSKGMPVRIIMNTQRYEVCTTLFDAVLHQQFGNGLDPQPLSPEDELNMGIMEDGGDIDGYYVKPADPDVMRARREGRKTDAVETLDIVTEGKLTRLTNPETGVETVTLAYEESELTGMEGSCTMVLFRSDDPGLVIMIRSGQVNTALTFRAHHRSLCTYNTPMMPFQIGIHGLVVDNRVLTDGVLILDYILEIRGARAERNRMVMTVAPM